MAAQSPSGRSAIAPKSVRSLVELDKRLSPLADASVMDWALGGLMFCIVGGDTVALPAPLEPS